MHYNELNTLETLISFLNEQDYNSYLDRDKINVFCHNYNIEKETLYKYKYSYFEFSISELNLTGLFCRYLYENNNEFPTLELWLEYAKDLAMHHFCFESDEGNYFEYEENKIMFEAISERCALTHYIGEIQKLVTLIDVQNILDSTIGSSNYESYIYEELNLTTNSDVLIYDYLTEEFINFSICQDGEMVLMIANVLFLNDSNTYTTESKGIKIQHFKSSLLKNKLNDKITIEYFNDIYSDRINEIINRENDWR